MPGDPAIAPTGQVDLGPVLHLTSSFPRSVDDYHAAFLGDLMEAQAAVGLRLIVVAPHQKALATSEYYGRTLVRRFRYGPDRAEALAYGGGLLNTVRTPLGLLMLAPFLAGFLLSALRTARQQKVSLIHAHWWLPAGLVGALVAWRLDLPLVVTCHGSDIELLNRPFLGPLGRWVIRRAQVVGAVSASAAARVTELTGVSTQVLRMPLPVAALAVGALSAPPPLKVLVAGRFSREKGFDLAVQAVLRLSADGVPVELSVVGEGPEAQNLRRLALDSEAVKFRPPLSPSELRSAIVSSHAVIAPSRHEGLGLVALQSVALGTPVIATDVGGLPEVVADGADGILVPPEDVDALVEALRRLPLAPARGAAARLHDPDRVAGCHLDAYRDALSGWRGHH